MNKKMFLLLILVLLLIGGVWFYSAPSHYRTDTLRQGGKLFPDLMAISSTIDTITLRDKKQGQLTFTLENGRWVIEEADRFPANVGLIRQLLHEMSHITQVEAKTQRPENYPYLGVEDLDHESATGTEVRLLSGGELQLGLLIGRYEMPLGTYVRQLGEAQSWLTDRRLILRTELKEWLQPRITELSPEEIAEIHFNSPERTPFYIRRETPGGEYTVFAQEGEISYEIKDQRAGDLLTELAENLSPIAATQIDIEALPPAFSENKWAESEWVPFEGNSLRFYSWEESGEFFLLYPLNVHPEKDDLATRTLWKVTISDTHYHRLNRTIDELALVPVEELIEELSEEATESIDL